MNDFNTESALHAEGGRPGFQPGGEGSSPSRATRFPWGNALVLPLNIVAMVMCAMNLGGEPFLGISPFMAAAANAIFVGLNSWVIYDWWTE